jgi:hypothetical protein
MFKRKISTASYSWNIVLKEILRISSKISKIKTLFGYQYTVIMIK